jgi:hypothetical protein
MVKPYSILLLAGLALAHQCPPAIQIDRKPQVFIMSDISNEPDDTQSFIRLLLHSDQYNITGMVATTSYWLNSTTTPDEILKLTSAYGKVVENLNKHSAGEFPTEEYLTSIVKSGHPVYGTAAIGKPLSSGAGRLIEVLDGMADDAVLHCQAWGGTNVLAEVLAHVRSSRTMYDQEKLYAKIRVYAISDQDNSGIWIRLNFPTIPYIASVHSWLQYARATWNGISGNRVSFVGEKRGVFKTIQFSCTHSNDTPSRTSAEQTPPSSTTPTSPPTSKSGPSARCTQT